MKLKYKYRHSLRGKSKSSPCTGLDRRRQLQEVEATRISRQSTHEGGNVVSPVHRPCLLLREDLWYSFLPEAESTSVLYCSRKSMKYLSNTIKIRNRDLPACSCFNAYPCLSLGACHNCFHLAIISVQVFITAHHLTLCSRWNSQDIPLLRARLNAPNNDCQVSVSFL